MSAFVALAVLILGFILAGLDNVEPGISKFGEWLMLFGLLLLLLIAVVEGRG